MQTQMRSSRGPTASRPSRCEGPQHVHVVHAGFRHVQMLVTCASLHGLSRCTAGRRQHRGRRLAVVTYAAMFDTLSRSMEKAFKLLGKDAKLTAENIKEPLREVRRALLEADVSLPVVRRFIKKVEEKALGTEVIVGVTPDTQFIKVVSNELVELMGSAGSKDLNPGFPQVILMAGLQGVGKTTACGKLALYLQKQKKSVLLVATDVYRPAAIDQLVKLGSTINVPVFEMGTTASPVDIARKGVEDGKARKVDVIIIDTAGRLQVDAEMMQELKDVKAATRPTDTLLVVDAMTGQEAASLVKAFNDEVDISGAIVTKMDGDSRGGAALSVREVSGKPIKFVGTGERMDNLEPFYPERMASRILGMGDVLSLFDKAAAVVNEEEALAMVKRIGEDKFDFNDFMKQMEQMNNMGGLKMLKMLPGMNKVSERQLYEQEKVFKAYAEMVKAMTEEERASPDLLVKSAGRRRRIAIESKHTEGEVSNLLAKFTQSKAQMVQMSRRLQLGAASGTQATQLMQDLVASTQRPVAEGKVRRKKEKVAGPPKEYKGFAVRK